VRFLGYDPAIIKTVTYVIAAVMAGIAGALFVPIVGIISPADVGVIPSIAFLIGVAIGGRATLLGPVLGALSVAIAQTGLSSTFPSFWVYFQGLLFVLVVGFMPGGLASLPAMIARLRRRRGPLQDPKAAGPARQDPPGQTGSPVPSPPGPATIPEEATR
jgi:urea transport system permease protein